MQRSKPKNEIVFWVLMDRNDSNIYTTLSELKDNYRYLTFFPEVVMKGIFSELYAAEGSNFTNKILLDPNTGEHVLHNGPSLDLQSVPQEEADDLICSKKSVKRGHR